MLFGAADIWSLGVMLYMLIVGDLQQEDDSDLTNPNVLYTLKSFSFEEDAWNDTSEEMMDFIELCLEPDSTRRLSAAQLLKNPFVKDAIAGELDSDVTQVYD